MWTELFSSLPLKFSENRGIGNLRVIWAELAEKDDFSGTPVELVNTSAFVGTDPRRPLHSRLAIDNPGVNDRL
jgi:hypothetical protein